MPQPTLCVQALDHLVLTVVDIPTTLMFYENAMGMRAEQFLVSDGSTRWALRFGEMKINLHQLRAEFEPKAAHPTPGSADMCFLTQMPLADWVDHFDQQGIHIEKGPVARSGATGPLSSIYIRDPDQNLIEIAVLS